MPTPTRCTYDAQHSMIRICARATFRSSTPLACQRVPVQRFFSCTQWRREDPRLDDFGRKITDDFAEMREKYGKFDINTFTLVPMLTHLRHTGMRRLSYHSRTALNVLETHHNPRTWPPRLRRTPARGTLPPGPTLLARHYGSAVAQWD
jgi:hypothetical protein